MRGFRQIINEFLFNRAYKKCKKLNFNIIWDSKIHTGSSDPNLQQNIYLHSHVNLLVNLDILIEEILMHNEDKQNRKKWGFYKKYV